MSECCVVVVDGTRARFFTLENSTMPEVESGPNLVEQANIANPDIQAPTRDLWSEKKTGRNRAAIGGPAHGYDDHRNNHQDEFERRFVRNIADTTSRLIHRHRIRHLVLVAHNRMLGFLRPTLESLQKTGLETSEVGKDLIKLSPHELQAHLAKEKLLPCRKRPRR